MTTNAAASGFKVALVGEATWGTNPGTGGAYIRLAGGAGKTGTETTMSREITTYEATDVVRTRVTGGGSYNFELSYETADKGLELVLGSVFGQAFSTNILKVGTLAKSMSNDVDKLGRRGDIVKVKDGFARNFLLPRGLGMPVNAANKAMIEKEKKAHQARLAKERAEFEALDVLARGLLAADGLRVSPSLQRRLGPDHDERSDALYGGEGPVATDYSLVGALIELQRAALGQLMSDAVATRLLDSEAKATDPKGFLPLAELYARLERDIWSELATGADIAPARRELQREHVNRLAAQLLRPGPF